MKSERGFDIGSANAGQREAIYATEGPVLIIAGPGTGKTFTLVKRIVYLIIEKKVEPGAIMAVTFTEKAARELLSRVSDELSAYGLGINVNEMYIGTFHALCLRLMKEYGTDLGIASPKRILDAFEQVYLVLRNIGLFRSIPGFSGYISASGAWQQASEICRYAGLLTEERADLHLMERDSDPDMRFLGKLILRYRALLQKEEAMDFSSMQTETYDMLVRDQDTLEAIRARIRYIMVDEYQDTNYIQEQLILLLGGKRQNIAVVGDDDQGMYRFRGATIRNILEFPSLFPENACRVLHLNDNYRSEPGTIDFCREWMESPDRLTLFNWNKYRYPKDLHAGRPPLLKDKSVYAVRGGSFDEEGKALVKTIRDLKERGTVSDYNQIAFLFRSVKSEEAANLAAFMEKNGIPVYSPRSDLFFERDEVRGMLGCILLCFLSYMGDLKKNMFPSPLSEKMRGYLIGCVKTAAALCRRNTALHEYIDGISRRLSGLSEDSSIGLLDIFYHLAAFPPFNGMLEADPNDGILKTRAARNLSELSRILSRFAYLHDMHTVSPLNKQTLPEYFFNTYLRYLYEDGISEYEDTSDYAPSGCVSFMTIHQAKGLEFPVVVVGSMNSRPRDSHDNLLATAETRFFHRKSFEPLDDIRYFDFWRLYYTAFSRARHLLILAFHHRVGRPFEEYSCTLPDIREFKEDIILPPVRKSRVRQIYSFTSHISVYDACPRQYKFYKEFGFAQHKMFQTSVGSLVHATLEDINRFAIAGKQELLTEAHIRDWFALNYNTMKEETGYHLTDEQKENALSQVLCYYAHRRDSLSRVWKAEEEILLVLPDFILQGVVDLIEGRGDTVEIVDYKTGPKPDVVHHPQLVSHYRKQLEIYAYLIQQRYGKAISRMHLYYTSVLDGDPLVTFEWKESDVEKTIRDLSETVRLIENRRFEEYAAQNYVCANCDLRFVCRKAAE